MIGLSRLLFGGMRTLGLWILRASECFKWGFMGHHKRNMENSGILNCGGLAEEVSEGENVSMWSRDPS